MLLYRGKSKGKISIIIHILFFPSTPEGNRHIDIDKYEQIYNWCVQFNACQLKGILVEARLKKGERNIFHKIV